MKLSQADFDDLQIIWDYLRIEDELPERADAIVVGGSGSRTDMAERAADALRRLEMNGFTAKPQDAALATKSFTGK